MKNNINSLASITPHCPLWIPSRCDFFFFLACLAMAAASSHSVENANKECETASSLCAAYTPSQLVHSAENERLPQVFCEVVNIQ